MSQLGAVRSNQPQKIEVKISSTKLDVVLDGMVILPENPVGIVLFAHGSGSTRSSPRNEKVAQTLARRRIGSVLFDLLTEAEAQNRKNVFDISLLSNRLVGVTNWLQFQSFSENKFIGFFGASTGGAAALMAAAQLGESVAAVVSRGGRADLVPNSLLMKVRCPTLLLVGELDEPVINWNRKALAYLPHGKMNIIPGASHLFEEEGTLDKMSDEAAAWFAKCFQDKKIETMINLQ